MKLTTGSVADQHNTAALDTGQLPGQPTDLENTLLPGQPIPSDQGPSFSGARKTNSPSGLAVVSLEEAEESDEEDKKPRKLSKAKIRFNKAALHVLTEVIDKKIKKDEIIEEEVESKSGDNGKKIKGERLRANTVPNAAPSTSVAGGGKPRRGMSLASLVGVMTFRKVYMSKLKAHAEKQVADKRLLSESSMGHIDEEGEDTPPLPVTPRFCATLSPEAQFAMLKGYEDKLIKNIKTTYPDDKDQLVRVKAPYGKKMQINDKRVGIDKEKEVVNVKNNKDLELRRLTVNFETAMNILDQIKTSRGERVLSSRSLRNDLPPIKRYTNWAKQWSRQFKTT